MSRKLNKDYSEVNLPILFNSIYLYKFFIEFEACSFCQRFWERWEGMEKVGGTVYRIGSRGEGRCIRRGGRKGKWGGGGVTPRADRSVS